MPEVNEVIDQETIYRLLQDREWGDLLALLHRHRKRLAEEPVLAHAADVVVRIFFDHLEREGPEHLKSELETLFLLHTGRFYRLDSEFYQMTVSHLASLHTESPEAAVGYARYLPDHPVCAEILERFDTRREVTHVQDRRIRVDANRPDQRLDLTIGLFRSPQEEAFFLAVREVFASYFAYPNVALSTLLDYERLEPHLSPEERRFFFHGVGDCVGFGQHDAYRPRFFFELDSAHHDDAGRQANDALKDRILAAAGRELLRIRRLDPSAGRLEFVRLLRELVNRA